MSQSEIVNRNDARARGLKRYFIGVACRHGHIAERRVANGACVKCSAIAEQKREKRVNSLAKKAYTAAYQRKIGDLIAVLRVEMPELLKEFGL